MGVERVGLDDIRTGLQILPMNVFDDRRLREIQQIVMPLEILLPILEALTSKGRLIQLPLLNHRPHRAIKDQDPFVQHLHDGPFLLSEHCHLLSGSDSC